MSKAIMRNDHITYYPSKDSAPFDETAHLWSRSAIFFYLYATILTFMPAAPFWFLGGADAAFLFLTGDAYLYLGIAQHSTPEFFSFDGELPTNGFHPLWQVYLWAVAQVTGNNSLALMNVAAISGIVCCWIGVMLLGIAIARGTGSWLLAGLSVPGVYFLLVGQGVGGNLSVWDFFNGMENGLALALTGTIALTTMKVRKDERRTSFWLGLGVLTGLLMLCRLDEVFVSAAIGVSWLLWNPRLWSERIRSVVLLGAPPFLMLVCYIAYNLSYMDIALPISGAAKGGMALLENGWVTVVSFFAPFSDLRAAVSDYSPSYQSLNAGAFRVSQLVFPALLALLYLIIIWKRFREAPWAAIVGGMCVAIIVKAGYNFVFVNYWHQASWYYAFAQGTLSLVTALLLAPALKHLRRSAPFLPSMLAFLISIISVQQMSGRYFHNAYEFGKSDYLDFFRNKEAINSELQRLVPNAKLLEFGDGMINFVLDRPVRHGFVFAGDSKSLAALRNRRLLQSSYEDGYNVLTSHEYYRWGNATPEISSDEIRTFLQLNGANYGIREELNNFNFEMIYVYEPLHIPFIAFTPK